MAAKRVKPAASQKTKPVKGKTTKKSSTTDDSAPRKIFVTYLNHPGDREIDLIRLFDSLAKKNKTSRSVLTTKLIVKELTRNGLLKSAKG